MLLTICKYYSKMATLNIIITLLSIFTVVTGQRVSFSGKCNNVTTQSNFDMSKYMGFWYEIEKYPTIFQGASCITVNYNLLKNGTIEVQNGMSFLGHNITIRGNVSEINSTAKDGKLKVYFPEIQSSSNEYWVLGTDYGNYSVTWFCNQLNNTTEQYAWILSRTPNLTDTQRNEVNKIIANNILDADRFIKVNQTQCYRKGNKHNDASLLRTSVFIFALILVNQLF